MKTGIRAGDWLGCGRVITQESWNGFLAAQSAYWQRKDKEKMNAIEKLALKQAEERAAELETLRAENARLREALKFALTWAREQYTIEQNKSDNSANIELLHDICNQADAALAERGQP